MLTESAAALAGAKGDHHDGDRHREAARAMVDSTKPRPRRACTFKQQDVTRALKATLAAGVKVSRIEIEKTGKIVLIADGVETPAREDENEWEVEQ
jgi:hypothetical protein